MKCTQCLFEDNCSLRKLAKDLTGCEGHSKERPPNEGEVKCSCCGQWRSTEKVFYHKTDTTKNLCFCCY